MPYTPINFRDPMRDQARQQFRMSQLQQMAAPQQPVPGTIVPQQHAAGGFDTARTLTGLAGAGLAGLGAAKLIPHPAAQAVGWGSTLLPAAAQILGGALGMVAAPAAIDTVAPGLHEGINSAVSHVGGPIPALGIPLAAALLMRRGMGAKAVAPQTSLRVGHPVSTGPVVAPSGPVQSPALRLLNGPQQASVAGYLPERPSVRFGQAPPISDDVILGSMAGQRPGFRAGQPIGANGEVAFQMPQSVSTQHLGPRAVSGTELIRMPDLSMQGNRAALNAMPVPDYMQDVALHSPLGDVMSHQVAKQYLNRIAADEMLAASIAEAAPQHDISRAAMAGLVPGRTTKAQMFITRKTSKKN